RMVRFNIEALFSRHHDPGPPRTIFINSPLPSEYLDPKGHVRSEYTWSSNQVITSKYTLLTFIPRNLLEQFRRIANIFFLVIAVLQFFPIFSTTSSVVAITPLLAVLATTLVKDGYEDLKRHQTDSRTNRSSVRVLAAAGWNNPNATRPKNQTFIPGFSWVKPQRWLATFTASRDPSVREGPNPDVECDPGEPGVMADSSQNFVPVDPSCGWKKTPWEDLRVGDIVKILDDEPLPADILICATSESDNIAYVETKNLDGETNLKSRAAVPLLTHMSSASACANSASSFHIQCGCPDTNMYKLDATVHTADGNACGTDLQMVLLRGSVLRHTRWLIGVVIFTGGETKAIMNSGSPPSKRSKLERQMNPLVLINLVLLAVLSVACGVLDSVLEQRFFPLGAPWLYGDDQSDDNPKINGLITWTFSLITFQNIIPIALYIGLEFVRSCQAAFIYFDKEMYHEKTATPARALNWTLSDDLGQIEYIFSDKQEPLLRCNVMEFRRCSVAGRLYGMGQTVESRPDISNINLASHSHASSASLQGQGVDIAITEVSRNSNSRVKANSDPTFSEMRFTDDSLASDIAFAASADAGSKKALNGHLLRGFFCTLALCHTVMATKDVDSDDISYKAQSPDEAALVQAAADVSFIFLGRDGDILIVQTPFSIAPERYELLNILEFNSARKRMSVLVRKADEDEGRVYLLTKGADNVIFERLAPGTPELTSVTEDHLQRFASEGLRMLTLAYRVITDYDYELWKQRYYEASVSLEGREAQIDAVCEEIERDLHLLGATAIEDKLQDGVPETIADLKEAGIKVWVATGDKLETAIAIGYSTNLINADDDVIVIRGGSASRNPVFAQLAAAERQLLTPAEDPQSTDRVQINLSLATYPPRNAPDVVPQNDRRGRSVLVIDGNALGEIFAEDDHKHSGLLLRLATRCEGVICCRVSPLQKAQIVTLVKQGVGAMTLAIGDGANDVNMIQAAHVGVGVSGEEGLQAVNASDDAIAQFRFLKRLLLVHDHWAYHRNSTMITNFFYKNVLCIGILWWYQFYCAFSSQYVFEYTYDLLWNTLFTIAPPIIIGIFDRVADDAILSALPQLYGHSRRGEYFGVRVFLIYMLEGVWQSTIIFFIILGAYTTTTSRTDGYDVYIFEFSTAMIIAAVIVYNTFQGLVTAAWSFPIALSLLIGPLIIWIYTPIYSAITSPTTTPVFGNNHYLFTAAYFWLGMLVVFVAALLPRFVGMADQFGLNPNLIDRVRWLQGLDPDHDFSQDRIAGLAHLERPLNEVNMHSRKGKRKVSLYPESASHVDMATGERGTYLGFDFTTEENGIALRKIQRNISQSGGARRRWVPAFIHHP
ncbi:phospholipid-translocating P-type ATPase, partial [Obba rivulosa]